MQHFSSFVKENAKIKDFFRPVPPVFFLEFFFVKSRKKKSPINKGENTIYFLENVLCNHKIGVLEDENNTIA